MNIEKKDRCYLCNRSALLQQRPRDYGRYYEAHCLRCGRYKIPSTRARESDAGVDSGVDPALVSFHIRSMSDAQSEPPYLTVDLLDKIKEKSLPTPSEAANRLLTWIGSNTKEFGEPILCDDLRLGGLVGVRSEQSLFAIIRALSERHFLNFSPTPSIEVPGPIEVTLTMTGWEHYEFLKRSAVDVSTAFIAMPFGEPDLTAFVDTHMRPAVAETGFTLRRADDAQRAGRIDDQMRLDIRNCRFLIADLTHGNRGAFWEAGYAEGLGKTVIYTCRKDKFHDADARHFDTNNHLTVKWTYEDPKSAMTSLKNTIRNSIPEAKQQDG